MWLALAGTWFQPIRASCRMTSKPKTTSGLEQVSLASMVGNARVPII